MSALEIMAMWWAGYHLICTLLYMVLYLAKQIEPYTETENGILAARVVERTSLYKLWRNGKIKTSGFALGFFIILIPSDAINNIRIMRHESAHVWQQLILGPLLPALYLLFSAALFCVLWDFYKAYYYNPFEIMARRSE